VWIATLTDAINLGIPVVYGEVYAGNTAVSFWHKLVDALEGDWQRIITTRDGHRVPAYRFEVRP
jgi:hypothetical protein